MIVSESLAWPSTAYREHAAPDYASWCARWLPGVDCCPTGEASSIVARASGVGGGRCLLSAGGGGGGSLLCSACAHLPCSSIVPPPSRPELRLLSCTAVRFILVSQPVT
jgi:hypothetical protein